MHTTIYTSSLEQPPHRPAAATATTAATVVVLLLLQLLLLMTRSMILLYALASYRVDALQQALMASRIVYVYVGHMV